MQNKDVREYEHFFRDPFVGDEMIKLSAASIACINIRDALRQLGYTIHFEDNGGQEYDQALEQQVLQFQRDNNHTSQDGLFGPGTRQLLARVLFEKRGPRAFGHMRDPEKYTFPDRNPDVIRKEILHRYDLIVTHKERLHILEVQAASFGALRVDPHVKREIDQTTSVILDLEKQIESLKKKLD